MGKIIIIGAGASDSQEFIKTSVQIAAQHPDITLIGENEIPDMNESFDFKRSEDIYTIESHLLELPFFPKKKHSPKGHERPYKFHR